MSNPIDSVTLLSTFLHIADRGSLSAASRVLGTSQASVSRQLQALERRLEVTLIRRSTHSMTLTEEGRALLPRARSLVEEWERLRAELGLTVEEPEGLLRVVGPTGHGPSLLAPLAARFTEQYPKVSVELHLTDGPVDLAALGADLMIRVGAVDGQDLKVRRIGQIERWLVATPELARRHFDRRGTPKGDPPPIVGLAPYYSERIHLTLTSGEDLYIEGVCRVRTTLLAAAHAAVVASGGIGLLPRWLVEGEVSEGALKRLCPHATVRALPVFIVHPPSLYRSARSVLFAQAVEEVYAAQAG